MNQKQFLALGLSLAAMAPLASSAALAVTNGGFGTANENARIVNSGGWFEASTTTNWGEGSWANPGSYPAAFPTGSGMALLMDGAYANAYIYQSLGTIDLSDIAAGTLRITSDFAEKSDDTTVNSTFTIYTGAWAGAGTGVDISGAGLSELFDVSLDAAAQGLTAGSGNVSRAVDVLVGDVDISGLSAGTEVWLRVGRPSSGSGDVIIDNIAVGVVPEPSVALLGGLGLLGLIRRRR